MSGLSVSRLVRVAINLSPTAAAARSFGVLMAAGDSTVISGLERYRTYTGLQGVADDFGVNAPEYFAAALYFGQTPKPRTIMIGRWLRTATAGFLNGGILTASDQLLSNFTAITSGTLSLSIDSVVKSLTGLNFSAAANINAVVAIVNGVLTGGVMSWDGQRFTITSSTTGIASLVTVATGTTSTLFKLTTVLASTPVPGYAAETPVQCAAVLANLTSAWYGLMFSASVEPTDDQSIAVSDFIEALDVTRIYGVTIVNTNVLDANVTSDLASRMKAGLYRQSFCQYSQNVYAIASFFGRAFSVDFNANRSTITMMYKIEPAVNAENLTETQAIVLQSKRCNVFVAYDNDTSIIQYGVMSGPAWFDEIHGVDWLQNRIQNDCYNLLYTSPTKIPQTDQGVGQVMNAVQGGLDAAVNNGLVAPGVWTGPNIGQLQTGQYLKSGYYLFAEPLALQSQADREARIAPPITACVKFSGAIQEIDVVLDVNR